MSLLATDAVVMIEVKDSAANRHAGGLIVLACLCLASCMAFVAGRSDHPPAAQPSAQSHSPFPRLAIDLNRASWSELSCLEGVGPTLAQRIVEFREQHGHYQSLDDLQHIPGIGPRLSSRLQQNCSVQPQAPSTSSFINERASSSKRIARQTNEAKHD